MNILNQRNITQVLRDGNIHVMPIGKDSYHIPLSSCECCPKSTDSDHGIKVFVHSLTENDLGSQWQTVDCTLDSQPF